MLTRGRLHALAEGCGDVQRLAPRSFEQLA